MTQLRGSLERWDDDKGFGFIAHVDYPKGIFVHISAFKRNINRRPVIGDMIIYELFNDADGKQKAVNAQIEGVSANPIRKNSSNKKSHHHNTKQKSSGSLVAVMVFLGIAIFIAFKYQQSLDKPAMVQPITTTPAPVVTPTQKFSCQGKTYCSEMSSCEEAQFYQNNCSGTKMDGDGDGRPCEDMCGH